MTMPLDRRPATRLPKTTSAARAAAGRPVDAVPAPRVLQATRAPQQLCFVFRRG